MVPVVIGRRRGRRFAVLSMVKAQTMRAFVDGIAAPTWIVGAFAASAVGLALGPLAAISVLAAALLATLLSARLSLGWRAVPVLFMALAAQTPVIVLLAVHALNAPLKRLWFPIYIYDQESLAASLLSTGGAVLLASPVGALLRLGEPVHRRVRAIACRALPIALVLASALVGLGVVRALRFPAPDAYVASLPNRIVLPSALEEHCEALPAAPGDSRHPIRSADCVTEELTIDNVAFHHHCRESRGERRCLLYYRLEEGPEHDAWTTGYESEPVSAAWDPHQSSWVLGDPSRPRVLTEGGPRWLQGSEICPWIAPPVGWVLLATGGLVAAFATSVVWRGLRRSSKHVDDSGWLAEFRGDCATVALGLVLLTSAGLVAAMLSGALL